MFSKLAFDKEHTKIIKFCNSSDSYKLELLVATVKNIVLICEDTLPDKIMH